MRIKFSTPKNAFSLFKISLVLIGCLSIVSFYYFLYAYSYNFPQNDDFDSPINSLNLFFENSNFLDRLKNLLSFHDDHRLFFLRSMALINVFVWGKLHFQGIVIVSNLFLILSLILLLKPLLKQIQFFVFIPVILLIFQFGYKEAILWAHVSTNYAPTLFFAILACYTASFGKKIYLPLIACIMASLCFGNGILSFISITLIWILQKNWKTLITWFVLSSICLSAYFIGHSSDPSLEVLNLNELTSKFVGFLALSGSNFHYLFNKISFTIIIGLLLTLGLVKLFYSSILEGLTPKDIFYFGTISFVLGTISVISISRFNSSFPIEMLLSNRYKFYSSILFGLVYILIVKSNSIKPVWIGVLSIFLLYFNVKTYYLEKTDLDYRVKKLLSSEANWVNNKRGLIFYETKQNDAIEYLNTFEKNGFYQPQNLDFLNYQLEIPVINDLEIILNEFPRKFGTFEFTQKVITISCTNTKVHFDRQEGVYFVLKSKLNTFIFGAKQNMHLGKLFYKQGIGYSAEFDSEYLVPGEYEVFQMNILGNTKKVYSTKQTIRI